MKDRRPPRSFRAALFAALLGGFVVACSSGTPVPPVEQKVVLAPGERAHGRFAVQNQDLYAVELVYPFDNAGQRSRAWDLAGAGRAPGADVTIRVQIYEIREAGSRLLRHRDVARPALTSWGEGALHAELTRLPLSPGLYTWDVRVLDATPALQQVPVRIAVREAYTGK